MPAFTTTLTDEQIWHLALFLKHMDHLPPAVQHIWQSAHNPASAAPASASAQDD